MFGISLYFLNAETVQKAYLVQNAYLVPLSLNSIFLAFDQVFCALTAFFQVCSSLNEGESGFPGPTARLYRSVIELGGFVDEIAKKCGPPTSPDSAP